MMGTRCAYIDCFNGVAGDMILGALLDAGWSAAELTELPRRLKLSGVVVTAERVDRGGLAAMQVRVDCPQSQPHRHLPDIIGLLAAGDLPDAVRERSGQIFMRLAEAEARVHGTRVEEVHFHEVGAADAIIDIVGACVGLASLGVEQVLATPLPTGSGTVQCAHGELPVPAPATLELLRGVPLSGVTVKGEAVTPTGAAILATLCNSFAPMPAMVASGIGYGAGTREQVGRPNVVRVVLGELGGVEASAEGDEVVVLEAQVDDATGEVLAHACERLLEGGALDAFIVPIIMKKGRPGQLLTVLAPPAEADALAEVLLRETTTLGVRRHGCRRTKAARELVTVETSFGPIRVKIGRRGGVIVQASPEYEDCVQAARRGGVTLREVQEAALRRWNAGEFAGDDRDPG